MSQPLAFVDTEATSLLPAMHDQGKRPWEIAVIRHEDGYRQAHLIYTDVPLLHADQESLRVGGYDERHPAATGVVPEIPGVGVHYLPDPKAAGALVESLVTGATLIAANPTYDADAITWLINQTYDLEHATPWHYRPYCVTTVGGTLANLPLPFDSTEVSKWLGVDRADFAPAHTALADALWHEAQYAALRARCGLSDLADLA
jgi:hypothetical protein